MTRSVSTWLVIAAGLLVATLFLALTARGGPLPGDVTLLQAIQAVLPVNDGLVGLAQRLELLTWLLPVLLLGVAVAWRWWRLAATGCLMVIATVGLGELVLKDLIARPRPAPDLAHVHVAMSSPSFPSSTSLLAGLIVGLVLVALAEPRCMTRVRLAHRALAALIGLGLTAAIGLSRLYLGVHWPSDILASWLLGGAASALAAHSLHPWQPRPAPGQSPLDTGTL